MDVAELRKTSFALLRGLSPRAREIVERRFGLRNKEPETLESIGRGFGITRERVRQIECGVLRKLREMLQQEGFAFVQKYYRDWLSHLRMHGGIRKEDAFLADIGGKYRGHATFLLVLTDAFEYVPETESLYSAWACDKTAVNAAREFVTAFVQNLRAFGRTMNDRELLAFYRKEVAKILPRVLPPSIVFSYLELSKDIGKGPHGAWGLQEWPEVNPRGLRDRAYLVYKKEGKPLHFTEVARLIDFHGFNPKGRKLLVQSVHNDLVRDPRFVLVGRGIYALTEWGYTPGIVRDVIADVLGSAGKALTAKEVVSRVLKQRQVKPSTILLNLQNKEYFVKNSDGKYTLAKASETTLA